MQGDKRLLQDCKPEILLQSENLNNDLANLVVCSENSFEADDFAELDPNAARCTYSHCDGASR